MQQYIETLQEKPLAIALQETGKKITLPGYQAFHSDRGEKSHVTTLVKRNIATIEHEIHSKTIEGVLVEMITGRKQEPSLFLLNIYSRPRQQKVRFRALFRAALKAAGRNPLVIVGDFNAHHEEWGYKKKDSKGRQLWEDIQELGLTLHTDSGCPTRKGNSVMADTSPDLTLSKNAPAIRWENTEQDLGSDHYIIATTLETGLSEDRSQQAKITKWERFREMREGIPAEDITDIESWTSKLKKHVAKATVTLEGQDAPAIADSKLLHMWEAKRGLERRLKKQRWNRNLKRRIARHNKEIERYAMQLCEHNWCGVCDDMAKGMSLAKTWNILRHLLDPTQSKTQTNIKLKKTRHAYQGEDKDFIKEIEQTYIGNITCSDLPAYKGVVREELDAPITEAEVRAELIRLKTKSAPGPDGITNKILRNLDDESIIALTKYMQQVWEKGKLPKQWKEASIILIPKPGKPPKLENLRPISLTSCVGKLMEHVVQTRLTRYMEDNSLWPDEMVGFRPKLSTQDVMLRLNHDIIDSSSRDAKVILGLDLKKAFDNVKHEAILEELQAIGAGQKTYDYIKDFLTNRTAKIRYQDIESGVITLGSRGTPQGSVLSPLLFNLAMRGLPEKLKKIGNIHFSMYADDVNIWINQGSDAEIEHKLQEAADVVVNYAANRGLACSPEKSALLVYNPRHLRLKQSNNFNITVGGQPVPMVDRIRILGLHIQSDGYNGETLKKLEGYAAQAIGIFRRIALKGRGLREKSLIKLVQAYVISRISYATPYLKIRASERDKLDTIIRGCYKRALGLPISTSTERLLDMGIHNTWREIAEATRTAQQDRLSQSNTGRAILSMVGLQTDRGILVKRDIPRDIREKIRVDPLPRNMHPTFNKARRGKRAEALTKRFGEMNEKAVAYTDAASGKLGAAVATVVSGRGTAVSSATIRSRNPESAEEVAIALACVGTEAQYIISDSKTAIQNYARGRITQEALRILEGRRINRNISLVWTPAHEAVPGNEAANALARDLYFRAAAGPPDSKELDERLINYTEIVENYKLNRRLFPPPDKELTNTEATAWRRLQAKNFIHPVWASHVLKDEDIDDKCRKCGERGTLDHVIWECADSPGFRENIDSREAWETLLQSTDPVVQKKAVHLAIAAARSQKLLACL